MNPETHIPSEPDSKDIVCSPLNDDSSTASVRRSSRGANTLFMLAGQFLGKGCLFASVMLLSRYLPDADFGALLFAVVMGQIYLLFSDMGVSMVLTMRCSVRPGDTQRLLSVSVSLRTILALFGFPLLIAAGLIMGMGTGRLILLALIGTSVVFEALAELFYAIFRAGEKMLYEAVSRIIMGFTGLIAILILIHFNAGVVFISASYILRALSAAAFSLIFIRRMGISLRPAFDLPSLKELLVTAMPLGIMGLIIIVHQKVDNVIIRQMLGEDYVAAWQQCLRIVEILILLVVPTLLPGALFPEMCRAFRKGTYRRQTGDMARVFTALAVSLSLAVVSAGNRLLELIWGSSYLRNVSPQDMQLCLYLSVGGLAVVYLMNIMISSLLALNRIRVVVPVTAVALAIVIAGNLLLIPAVGLPSAGVLFIAGNLFILLCYYFYLRWRGYRLPIWGKALRSVLAAVPAFAVTFYAVDLELLPAVLLPLAVYIPVWWFTGGGDAFKRLFPLNVIRD
ncbi:MAG: oligosaccharide flippase family protein [Candidatus Aegiribacteria sp.]|nr:oligosaccharide flippase family protein [Candidatus Aegiribacteria sp.]MBD3294204.1 oligosaccharide flippase family protein [Candidatus Fermentibacteria bacterium]